MEPTLSFAEKYYLKFTCKHKPAKGKIGFPFLTLHSHCELPNYHPSSENEKSSSSVALGKKKMF